jgi:hypothetical protein
VVGSTVIVRPSNTVVILMATLVRVSTVVGGLELSYEPFAESCPSRWV